MFCRDVPAGHRRCVFSCLRKSDIQTQKKTKRLRRAAEAFSVSKNWLADSKLPKCGVRRRIGKPLDRVSHDATAHRAVASPFLILMKAKDFASGGTRQGLRPLTPPPFRKRRAKTFCGKLFVHYFLRNDFFDSLSLRSKSAGRFVLILIK